MCSFSNNAYRQSAKGNMTPDEIEGIAKTLFSRAFQVVIGCAAEPTLNKHYLKIIELANVYKVPNISLVTNGMNLNDESIKALLKSNLHELIISMHGVTKNVYEYFMENANHQQFMSVLRLITTMKTNENLIYPKIRLNYTVNNENISELDDFFNWYGDFNIHTLQIRPIQDLGGEYRKPLSDHSKVLYQRIVSGLLIQAKSKKITIIAGNVGDTKDENNKKTTQNNQGVIDAVYCYISPHTATQLKINWLNCSFKKFSKKYKWEKNLLSALFSSASKKHPDNILNYQVFD